MQDTKGLFGFRLCLPCQHTGKPKYWRTILSPVPSQILGMKLYWKAEVGMGTPNDGLQTKQCPTTWSTPIIWLGSLGLPSKQTLTLRSIRTSSAYFRNQLVLLSEFSTFNSLSSSSLQRLQVTRFKLHPNTSLNPKK